MHGTGLTRAELLKRTWHGHELENVVEKQQGENGLSLPDGPAGQLDPPSLTNK